SKRPRASLQTTNLHGDLCSARSLLWSWRQNAGPGAMERANERSRFRTNCRCRAEGNRACTGGAFVDAVAGFRLANEDRWRQASVPAARADGQDSPRGRGAEAIQVKRYRVGQWN